MQRPQLQSLACHRPLPELRPERLRICSCRCCRATRLISARLPCCPMFRAKRWTAAMPARVDFPARPSFKQAAQARSARSHPTARSGRPPPQAQRGSPLCLARLPAVLRPPVARPACRTACGLAMRRSLVRATPSLGPAVTQRRSSTACRTRISRQRHQASDRASRLASVDPSLLRFHSSGTSALLRRLQLRRPPSVWVTSGVQWGLRPTLSLRRASGLRRPSPVSQPTRHTRRSNILNGRHLRCLRMRRHNSSSRRFSNTAGNTVELKIQSGINEHTPPSVAACRAAARRPECPAKTRRYRSEEGTAMAW